MPASTMPMRSQYRGRGGFDKHSMRGVVDPQYRVVTNRDYLKQDALVCRSGSRLILPIDCPAPFNVNSEIERSPSNPFPEQIGMLVVGNAGSPVELAPVVDAIDRSRRILDLADDWDGDDSLGYSQTTWNRMSRFVQSNSLQLWRVTGRPAPAPSISPAQDGSIDVLWKHEGRKLLLNVPADERQSASYYGEAAPDDTVNGSVPTTGENYWLLLWLMR